MRTSACPYLCTDTSISLLLGATQDTLGRDRATHLSPPQCGCPLNPVSDSSTGLQLTLISFRPSPTMHMTLDVGQKAEASGK